MASITVTLPDKVDERLRRLAAHEGRSISNLAAYLLEHSIDQKVEAYPRYGEAKPDMGQESNGEEG